jgi:hypothetical protein
MSLGIGISPMLRRYRASVYGAYTTAWYTQVLANGGTATPTELSALTVFETALGSDLAEFDRLGIMGLQNSIAARTSFVNPTSTMLTLVNSPTFTAGLGYNGNGTTSYLNTNYNPNTQGVKYTLNSSSIFIYSRTNLNSTVLDIGCSVAGNQSILDIRDGGSFFSGINQVGNISSANSDSSGLFVGRRTASNAVAQFKNGVQTQTGAGVSTLVPNLNFYVGCLNNSGAAALFSPRQLSAYGCGSGVINQSTFYTALQALATTLGFNV